MPSVILYAIDPSGARPECGPCSKCDGYTKVLKVKNGPDIYVRAETSKLDAMNALMKCKPRKGEIVLNTIDI